MREGAAPGCAWRSADSNVERRAGHAVASRLSRLCGRTPVADATAVPSRCSSRRARVQAT